MTKISKQKKHIIFISDNAAFVFLFVSNHEKFFPKDFIPFPLFSGVNVSFSPECRRGEFELPLTHKKTLKNNI